mmetsp:Transcript_19747/g.62823  ORF Transcript_19747/g.62823 Transcript_19747/m.62823 type:complete len:260 (-) Transcript_19747:64-843(-)|eukprot:CAMPEP_0182856822 /NCGR_PEP_ID=MMETSP0034_2-20130328/2673_1 /TAXON_ID=156128 /ORGANISM="Nephroselmis pyriformis, Strain CCMP717" /LENGTH=259 /DNA_ID=CAMNT_0024987969 /DNA_START=43 /DNA_END=822 /DNA_ORIENTATION=+
MASCIVSSTCAVPRASSLRMGRPCRKGGAGGTSRLSRSKANVPAALRIAPTPAPRAGRAGLKCAAATEGASVSRRGILSASTAVAAALVIGPEQALAGKYTGPPVGAAAPDFTLPSTTGKDISLKDLTAKGLTVLYFYNQDGSPGCSIEAQRFQQSLGDFEKRGAQVVGVSMDSLEKHAEACSKGGLTFPLLSDNDSSVSPAYGADLSIPILGRFSDRQTFLIGTDGVIKAHWLESDKSMASVKTTAHVEQILGAIDAL